MTFTIRFLNSYFIAYLYVAFLHGFISNRQTSSALINGQSSRRTCLNLFTFLSPPT